MAPAEIQAWGGIAIGLFNAWLIYKARIATQAVHDCLDEHREKARLATQDLKQMFLALHQENKPALSEIKETVAEIKQEVSKNE